MIDLVVQSSNGPINDFMIELGEESLSNYMKGRIRTTDPQEINAFFGRMYIHCVLGQIMLNVD